MFDRLTGASRLFPIIGDPVEYVEAPARLTRTFRSVTTTASAFRCTYRPVTSTLSWQL